MSVPPRTRSKDGSRHVTDERINMWLHLVAGVFAAAGAAWLIARAAAAGKPRHVVGFALYGATQVLLFLASALHHGVTASARTERRLQLFDYLAIFLLIAGCITPPALILADGPLGWSVFGVAWALALAGILLKTLRPDTPKGVTNTLYLAMGWLTLALVRPVYAKTGWLGLGLMGAAGLFYTVGAVVYAVERPNPFPGRFGFHEIWHVFVIHGAVGTYLFMTLCLLPLP